MPVSANVRAHAYCLGSAKPYQWRLIIWRVALSLIAKFGASLALCGYGGGNERPNSCRKVVAAEACHVSSVPAHMSRNLFVCHIVPSFKMRPNPSFERDAFGAPQLER